MALFAAVFLFALLEAGLVDLVLVVFFGLLTVRTFDELVVNVLQTVQMRDAVFAVILVLSLLENILINSEHLKIVLKALQIADWLFERLEAIGANT